MRERSSKRIHLLRTIQIAMMLLTAFIAIFAIAETNSVELATQFRDHEIEKR